MGVTVTTRLPDDLARGIKHISKIENLDTSSIVRRLLASSVYEWKIEYALKQYKEGKITIWKAARMCNLTLREMLNLASEKGIPFQYTLEDLRDDYNAIMK